MIYWIYDLYTYNSADDEIKTAFINKVKEFLKGKITSIKNKIENQNSMSELDILHRRIEEDNYIKNLLDNLENDIIENKKVDNKYATEFFNIMEKNQQPEAAAAKAEKERAAAAAKIQAQYRRKHVRQAQAEERTNIDELLEKTDIPDKYKDIMKKIDELQKSITNKLDNIDTIKKELDRFFKNLYKFQGDFEDKINSLKKKYKYYNYMINWEIIFVNTSSKDTTINKLTEKVYKDSSFIYDNNYNYLIINIKKLLENYEESNKMELSNVIMKKIGQGGLDNKKEELILVCIKEIEKYYNIYEKKEEEKKEEEKDEIDETDKNIIGKCYMLFYNSSKNNKSK